MVDDDAARELCVVGALLGLAGWAIAVGVTVAGLIGWKRRR